MLLAEVVQDPEAHLPGLGHGEQGDAARIKPGTEAQIGAETQVRRRTRGEFFRLHTITPA